jgi:hypothetical protein
MFRAVAVFMRTLALLASLLLPCVLLAQTPTIPTPEQLRTDLTHALVGDWAGVLEYRDYSEPPTSTKRTQLPTWLSITTSSTALTWSYIYDDGPTKTVTETDTVTFDPAASTYTESDNGKPAKVSTVTGYNRLREGRGLLILSGTGIDNNKPSETRLTLTIRRNLLTLLEEVRPAHSTDPFTFRHSFTFTRAHPPELPAAK